MQGTRPHPDIRTADSLVKWLVLETLLTIPGDDSGGNIVGITPITFDRPQEGDNVDDEADQTLSELIANDYICKRILGNLFVVNNSSFILSGADTTAPAIQVTAGFFVSRAAPPAEVNGGMVPIGSSADVGIQRANYDPDHPDTAREPWMWRRTWILGNAGYRGYIDDNGGGNLSGLAGWSTWPSNNGHGSLRDGTQIDIKSRRRIRNDERLFMAVSMKPMPWGGLNPNFAGNISCEIGVNVRLFGSLVKARNSSNF